MRYIRASKFQSTLPTRGSDVHALAIPSKPRCFNPRSPRGGATLICKNGESFPMMFQSTLPTRGSDAMVKRLAATDMVSIHAPHEGERHRQPQKYHHRQIQFQSTLPTRGSDQSTLPTRGSDSCFNPRSPRGGATRRGSGRQNRGIRGFNPRSPRGGATAKKCIYMQHFREFAEYYPLRHGDARCIAPQDCIIQAFFGAKKRCFYVRLCFALKNKGVRG